MSQRVFVRNLGGTPIVVDVAEASDTSDLGAIFLNVKDFGAIGDGAADDTTAIQDTVDAALAADEEGGISTVFFPPGEYLISSSITVETDDGRYIAFQGMAKTTLTGSFAGFLIDRTSASQPNLNVTIRDMSFTNSSSSSSSGCIRMLNTEFSHISDCTFSINGGIGIKQDNSNFNPCITNVRMRGTGVPIPSTRVGIDFSSGGGGFISGFDIGGCAIGIDHAGYLVEGGRMEQNLIGIEGGGLVQGCSFEANNIGIKASDMIIINCVILADNFSAQSLTTTGDFTSGSPIVTNIPSTADMYGGSIFDITDDGVVIPGSTEILTVDSATQVTMNANALSTASTHTFRYHTPSTHGINFTGGHNTIIKVSSGGPFSIASVGWSNQDPGNWTTQPGHRNTFIECQVTNSLGSQPDYRLPNDGTNPQPQGTTFIGCQPTPSVVCKFDQLPEGAFLFEGDMRDIDDCNTVVWGANAAGGGTDNVLVRYNGTNWTVVGK